MKTTFRLLWLFIIGAFLLKGSPTAVGFPATEPAPPKSWDQAKPPITPLVVMISSQFADGQKLGAGIIIGAENDRVYIATANHLIRGRAEQAKVRVRFKWLPGEGIDANVLEDADPARDVGMLEVKGLNRLAIPGANLPFERQGYAPASRPLESVYSLGNPDGQMWNLGATPNKVAERDGEHIVFESAFIRDGDSGGALLNDRYQLVGMITRYDGVKGTAVSIEALLGIASKWGYPVALKPADSEVSQPGASVGGNGTFHLRVVRHHAELKKDGELEDIIEMVSPNGEDLSQAKVQPDGNAPGHIEVSKVHFLGPGRIEAYIHVVKDTAPGHYRLVVTTPKGESCYVDYIVL